MPQRLEGDHRKHYIPATLTLAEEKILDAYVLEQFALDPTKDSGSIAADATMEGLIPGKVVAFKDVSRSKTRQDLFLHSNEPVSTNISKPPIQRREPDMARRTPEEKTKMYEIISNNPTVKGEALVALLNKETWSTGPVTLSQANLARCLFKKERGLGKPGASKEAPKERAARKVRAARKTDASAVDENLSFESLQLEIKEIGERLGQLSSSVKMLQDKQKEAFASFLA